MNDVVVREESFDGLVYYSFVDGTGLWSKNDDLSWSLNAPLYVGEYAGFFVVFNTTSSTGNITNVVIAESDKTDNKTSNNTTVVNPIADLSVVKLVSNSNPNLGDVIAWTIIVTNNGPCDSENVLVIDKLPFGLIYQSSEASIGRYDAATGIWTIGNLVHGSTATLSIKTLVYISNKEILNVAVVNGSTYDPNPDNNRANNTTNVNHSADVGIIKRLIAIDGESVTQATAVNGQKLVWAIVVGNDGPDTAVNTRVVDVLPNSLVSLSYNATKGSFDPTTGVWFIGDLEYDEVVILVIETLVNGTGKIINEARVTSDTYDPNMTNNYDFDIIVVQDVPDVKPPVPAHESVNVTPATGNPLVMVLLALFVLAAGILRRRK